MFLKQGNILFSIAPVVIIHNHVKSRLSFVNSSATFPCTIFLPTWRTVLQMFSVDSRTAAPRGDVQRLYEPLLCFPFSGMLYCISSDTQRWGFLWGWGGGGEREDCPSLTQGAALTSHPPHHIPPLVLKEMFHNITLKNYLSFLLHLTTEVYEC